MKNTPGPGGSQGSRGKASASQLRQDCSSSEAFGDVGVVSMVNTNGGSPGNEGWEPASYVTCVTNNGPRYHGTSERTARR